LRQKSYLHLHHSLWRDQFKPPSELPLDFDYKVVIRSGAG
jgi:hypothetical protein